MNAVLLVMTFFRCFLVIVFTFLAGKSVKFTDIIVLTFHIRCVL